MKKFFIYALLRKFVEEGGLVRYDVLKLNSFGVVSGAIDFFITRRFCEFD